MTERKFIEIWNITIAIFALLVSLALSGVGIYMAWLVIKALRKYLGI